MTDALFGPDGTQAPPPPPAYRDALSGPVTGSSPTPSPAPPVRTRPPAPVKPSRPPERIRRAVADAQGRPAAERTPVVPSAYEAPQRVGPARPVATTPRRRSGSGVIVWLVVLVVFGSLAFNVLHGVLRDLGILR